MICIILNEEGFVNAFPPQPKALFWTRAFHWLNAFYEAMNREPIDQLDLRVSALERRLGPADAHKPAALNAAPAAWKSEV